MTTITISRQFGSGAEEIIEEICQELNYRQFGKIEIKQAALEAGLSELENLDLSEDNYKLKNFFERLFKWPTTITQAQIWNEESKTIKSINIDETNALDLVQKAVQKAHQAGNMVIVGRGGQIILKGMDNCLHLRIEADLEDRIQRIKNHLKHERDAFGPGDTVALRREAQDMIADQDKISAAYIRQFYDMDWDDPILYDLVINTSRTGIDKAVQTIIEKVNSLQPAF